MFPVGQGHRIWHSSAPSGYCSFAISGTSPKLRRPKAVVSSRPYKVSNNTK